MSEVKLPVNITAKFIKDLLDAGVTKIEIKADGSISIEKDHVAAPYTPWSYYPYYRFSLTDKPVPPSYGGVDFIMPNTVTCDGNGGMLGGGASTHVNLDPDRYED